MKITAGMLLMGAALAGSSCATSPDWIERTLVTVDVTGTWYGRALTATTGLGGRPAPSLLDDSARWRAG